VRHLFLILSLLAFLSVGAFAQEDPSESSVLPPPRDPLLEGHHHDADKKVVSDAGPFIMALSRSGTLSLSNSPNLTGQQRADVVRKRLDKVIRRYDTVPQSVYVDATLGPVVVRTKHEILATVLDEDLPEYFIDIEDAETRRTIKLRVAEKWREALQYELNAGAFFRTPAYLRLAFWTSVALLFAAFVLHKLLDWFGRRFLHRPAWAMKLVVWLTLFLSILWLSPTTKRLSLSLFHGVMQPYLKASVVTVGCILFVNIGEELVLRYYRALLQYTPDSNVRITQRVAALTQAATTILRIVVVIVGIFLFLTQFDIEWAPVATGAGILGVAVSLAAQDLLRDLVAGTNILMEDQFGVGDWVQIQGEIGEVEGFNLRSTSVRTRNGALITFQNSSLNKVSNLSKRWAQVDFQVSVSYGDDLNRCLKVMMEEIEGLIQDWPEKIVDEPELLGVEELGAHGITLRCLLRTKPLAQFAVHRELNLRVKNRFDKENITIPFPQQTVWHRKELIEIPESEGD
jgi:small-conductance mechanosensitive channel